MTNMDLSFSRCGLVAALLACSLCSATGCKSGAWGWPASNNWLSWKNWGKATGPDATALASKPSTAAPKPSSTATPQPTMSIAATGTGVANSATSSSATSPTYTASANAAYPTTPQGYTSPYATQAASAY